MKSLPALFMRGGTSKALMLHRRDLPALTSESKSEWDSIFLSLLGSPDSYERQLNGMGGGSSSLSKIAVIEPSSREDADLDYTFVQVAVDRALVDYKGNCGNISSAVAPFAIETGLLSYPDGEAVVRIFNTNTEKIIHAKLKIQNGRPNYQGQLQIAGVSGSGADIELSFLNPGGASTGSLFPGGEKFHILELPGFLSTAQQLGLSKVASEKLSAKYFNTKQLKIWVMDVANAAFFIEATALGLNLNNENPVQTAHTEIQNQNQNQIHNQNIELLEFLAVVRSWISVKMKIAPSFSDAQKITTIPYGVLFKTPLENENGDKIEIGDISVWALAGKKIHLAFPLTVSLGTAAFYKMILQPRSNKDRVRLITPAGDLEVGVDLGLETETISAGKFYRTAKLLMRGEVYY